MGSYEPVVRLLISQTLKLSTPEIGILDIIMSEFAKSAYVQMANATWETA